MTVLVGVSGYLCAKYQSETDDLPDAAQDGKNGIDNENADGYETNSNDN